jgi:pimeloyl-ACP methyl ester carboxylesterase
MSLGRSDTASRVPAAAKSGFGRLSIRPEHVTETFYNGCAPDDAQRSIARLVPTPILPLLQGADRPDDRRVPQAYVECTRDQAISIELQRRMHRRFAMQRVVTMEADHSPFLSAPEELAAHLDSLAQSFTGSAS